MSSYIEVRAIRYPRFDGRKATSRELLDIGWWFYCPKCGRRATAHGGAITVDDDTAYCGVACAGLTITGRRTAEPQLQQIPIRTEDGRKIREAFTPPHTALSADYTQIECRILAQLEAADDKP